jgi:predicted amidohydrolase
VLGAVRDAAARHGLWDPSGLARPCRGTCRWPAREPRLRDRRSGAIRAVMTRSTSSMSTSHGESWRESPAYAPGSVRVAETPLGPLGLSVCYDLRFRIFTGADGSGATMLSVPAAFTVPTGRHIGTFSCGHERLRRACSWWPPRRSGAMRWSGDLGHSLLIDPWGRFCSTWGEARPRLCEIDIAAVDQVRSRLPAIHHRRPIAEPELAG